MRELTRPKKGPTKFEKNASEAYVRAFEEMQKRSFRKGKLTFRYEEEIVHTSEVMIALLQMSHGNCAFCESPIEETHLTPGIIQHFRPAARTEDLGKKIWRDHYWWLAYNWDNLHPVCIDCQRHKKRRFPVALKRAIFEEGTTGIKREQPLLIDPCDGNWADHLQYLEHGPIVALSERGEITIKVYGLNRSNLVKFRSNIASEMLSKWSDAPPKISKTRYEAALDIVRTEYLPNETVPFFSTRYTVLKKLESRGAKFRISPKFKTPKKKKIAKLTRTKFKKKSDRGKLIELDWLRSIKIKNFRGINDLELAFPEATSKREPWIVLLGENAVGKSSILKAIVLAISTAADRRRLMPRAGDCFNRKTKGKNGLIQIDFETRSKPLELHFRRDSQVFEVRGKPPPVDAFPLLAYGSTRLLPPTGQKTRAVTRVRNVNNLFDPRHLLADVEPWLTNVKQLDAARFGFLAESLMKILDPQIGERLSRRSGKLWAHLNGARVPMRDLSDGYQSVLALTLDMIYYLARSSFDLETATGTVLLDEIEVHLHPSWKLAIVELMREMFPKVRFIVTTHDPLCLRGTQNGEVHLLHRDNTSGVVQIRQIDVPPGLDADELLTGAWFGLPSTLDDDTLEKLNDYNKILLKRGRSRSDKVERERLEQILRKRMGRFAETSEEKLAMRVVAEHRSQTSKPTDRLGDQTELRNKILDRIKAHNVGK